MTRDMTSGSPAKLIFLFTIPLLIGNLFQQFYNMADTLIVGRVLGVNALAAVGCTGSLMFFVLGFSVGLTTGLAVLTAQRFGAGDLAGVRRSFAVGILISAAVTVVLTLISVTAARSVLVLLKTPPELLDQACQYITVIFAWLGVSMLYNFLSNILRALGDSKTPLLFLVVACVINIALDILFIASLDMGVVGAAWATVIAQTVAGLLCVLFIYKKFPMLHLKREDWRFKEGEVGAHLRLALPMGFQSSIIAIGAILLQFALNGLGAIAVAAYTASQKVDTMATMPMMSFGMTMATYAAQNYGAGNIARIRSGVRACVLMSVSFSIAMGLVNIFFGRFLVGLFVGEQAAVTELAQIYLTICGATYFILSLLFIFRYTLQGLGQSLVPTIAGVMELVMRSLAAVFLANLFGFAGACAANPLAWLGSCVPLMIAFFLTMRRLHLTEETPPGTAITK